MIEIKQGADLLLLRYNDYKKYDFIEEHQKIIDEHGFTWIYKIGRSITKRKLKKVMNESGQLLLRSPKTKGGKIYISPILEYAYGMPKNDYVFPEYYQELVADDREWRMQSLEGSWLKIGTIEEVPIEESKKIRLISNGKPVLEVLDATMSSMLYVRYFNTSYNGKEEQLDEDSVL